MKSLPLVARIYVSTVVLAGAVTLVAAPVLYGHLFRHPILLIALAILSSVTSVFKVNLPLAKSMSTMSVSYAVDFAALLILGPNDAMIVALLSAWSQCTFRQRDHSRNPTYRTLFSMACLVITVQVAGHVYIGLGAVPGRIAWSTLADPLLGAATVYFALNTVMIATAIGLSTRERPHRVWSENFLWSAPSYFVGALVAAGASTAFLMGGWGLITLAAFPVYFTYRTYRTYLGRIEDGQRHVQQVSELHLATIESLALAIDAKDQTAHTHIRRVQTFAAGIAQAFNLDDQQIQAIKTAALLHDIGKLAVPEHILSKPGPLTPEEFQKIRIHPQIGAEIIEAVPFPYPVAPLILSHHERWDGKGYPNGLKGEEIPLGARILAVVDYFDALVSDRPYHRAMTDEAALQLVKQEAGKALDPKMVAKFIELFDQLEAEAVRAVHGVRKLSVAKGTDGAKDAAIVKAPQVAKKVFEDIALAQKEIYALYELAQAMGTSLSVADTMALIASKMSNLVPFSCCALFLFDEETDILRCRFATGVDADVVRQISVKSGQGLTGWVARNRRPLVNARPSADLEGAGLASLATSLQSALVCPLIFNDRFIGTLSVYHAEPGCYSDDHRRLLDRICEQAAATIHNSMVFEQTQEDSLTDALTGLPNTRFMFMHLTSELARAERLAQEMALLVMDLDDFKQINDNHGHHVGDRALREVAQILRSAIRPYDICVRYAGDEFIVVLSGCGAEEAEQKRLELQAAVDAAIFEARPGKTIRLGISVGAAVYPTDGEVYETLLMAADQRMYRDKAARKRPVHPPHAIGVEHDAQMAQPMVASGSFGVESLERMVASSRDLRGGVMRLL